VEAITLEYVDVFDENKTKTLSFSKHLIKESFNEKSLFANQVDGKSMQPVINHKAVVVSDISNKILVDEAIYLLYYENKMWIKKYDGKKEVFISINKEFSHLVYAKEKVHIVGRVLLTFTTF
jgi:phage repressor protein C with HTH and peptisase S24 domain